MSILPAYLDMPLATSAGAVFDGSYLTARDISYAIAVAHIAARGKPEDGSEDHFRIPDNRLRAALGRTRRDDVETENARFDRLRDAVMILGDDRIPMPTLMRRGDIPVRGNLDDELTWVVDPRMRAAFAPTQDHVLLPTALLAGARHSWTATLVMRLLAAHAQGHEAGGVVAHARDRIGLRLTFPELVDRFHLPDMAPGVLMQKIIEPASKDAFDAAGISIEIEARRTFTHRQPKGKFRDVLIYLVLPGLSPLETKIQEQQEGSWRRKPSTTGKKRGRPKKQPAPPVADSSNVTVLRPRSTASIPRSEFHKMPPSVSGLDQHVRDTDDIEI